MSTNFKERRWAAVPFVVLTVTWWAVAQTRWAALHAIPAPTEVFDAARHELTSFSLWLDLLATVARVTAGTTIAVVLGTTLGIALATTPRIWRASEPAVEFVRSIPPILTYPLCLLSLGYGESARLVAIVFGTTGVVIIHVSRALGQAPTARAEIVRLAGLRGFDAVRALHAYELLPALFTGTRLALTGALIISVVTEMLVGARYGLGSRAQSALLEYRADLLWLVILLAGAASVTMSALLLMLERRVVDWRED